MPAARSHLIAGSTVTVLAVAAAGWLVPTHTNLAPSAGNDIAPAFMPLLCAGLIGVLGAGMVVRALLGRVPVAAVDDEAGGADPATPRQVLADLAVWTASTVLVLLAMPRLGFVVTGSLLLAGWLAYARVRSWPAAAGVVVLVPLVLDWLCWHVLKIQLP